MVMSDMTMTNNFRNSAFQCEGLVELIPVTAEELFLKACTLTVHMLLTQFSVVSCEDDGKHSVFKINVRHNVQ